MSSLNQPAEFFVVGGPVQPERPCYVERAADRALESAVRNARLCCVLGPRGSGKTSLLLRLARTLRAARAKVAVVELRKLAARSDEAPDRWLRSVAQRIAAELKLGVDVDAWWEARSAQPGDSRLAEFFWQVVLTNTTVPIVVLVDDVETLPSLPFAAELLAAITSCYSRRERERDFARINFVLAGCTSLRQLAGEDGGDEWLAKAEVIEPADFTAAEAYRLAVAFGGAPELAQALLDRICGWTDGQPYLTQKVARGVARKGGRLEDVERVVREQLLAPGAADADPLLRQLRGTLAEPVRAARRATRLLQRVAAGRKAARPADAGVWERLSLSGAARVDADGRLRARNRIVKELVAARWLKGAGGGLRYAVAAAVVAAALAAGGYWYTQRLPVDDVGALTDAALELGAQEEAYRRLHALPGFAERAERLWLDALERRSRAATTLAEVTAVDRRLRELPGQNEPAERLLGDFWLRRARAAAHAEQRDAALLMAQRAAALPAAEPRAAAYLAELVGDDYGYLDRSLRLASVPAYWHLRFAPSELLWLDAERQLLRAPFGTAVAGGALGAAPARLTAQQHAALVREQSVDGEGTAGVFELSLDLKHTAPGELLVTLRAPNGAEAAVDVPGGDDTTVVFEATQGSPLAQLADVGLRGVWRLTVVDRAAGNTGVLAGWGLRFGDVAARDDFAALEIPDPVRVEDVAVLAVGERAAVWPTTAGVIGSVALWNLATGQIEHDWTMRAAPRTVAIDATGTRALAATSDELVLWSTADGALVARVTTETEFVLPPVFSTDGAYVAIAERVDGARPLVSVLRSSDASHVSSIEGPAAATSWELGPGARYLAVLGPATTVRVLDTRRGAELKRLPHELPVVRLLHGGAGDMLVTVDGSGALAAWSLAAAAATAPRPLGRTVTAAGVSLAGNGARLAYPRADGAVAVVELPAAREIARLRLPRSTAAAATQLAPDGLELVTQSGASFKRWRLPAAAPSQAPAPAAAAPTALGLDRAGDWVALGSRSGQVEIGPVAQLAERRAGLAFFGHRGAVTVAAVDAARGLAATGGVDGIVRLWDAMGAPAGVVMQPASAPVTTVALAADGSAVATAAGATVRIANVADGRVVAELAAQGAVSVMRFAPAAATLAVGDDGGAVTLTSANGGGRPIVARLPAAVTTLAFTPDGARVAVGDAAGAVRFVSVADGAPSSIVREWPQTSIRWLDFSPDGRTLFVATDGWWHALDATTPALLPVASRLAAVPSALRQLTPVSATVLRTADIDATGNVAFASVDLAAEPAESAAAAALVARDWPPALGLRLDDDGEPVLFDP